jgi:hypothetical protein
MFSSTEPVITTPTDQVSVTVVRKSDGQSVTFVLNEKTHIHDLKHELKRRLKPQFNQSCRLIFRDKVLKSKNTLKHYGIKKGVNDQAISSRSNFFLKYIFYIIFYIQWMIQKIRNRHHHHHHHRILNKKNNFISE